MLRSSTVILIFLYASAAFGQEHLQKNLEYYIRQAEANSPLIRDFKNQIKASRIDSAIIRAELKPQVSAVSNFVYAPVINGWGYDEAVTNGGTYSSVISVSKAFSGRSNQNTKFRSLQLLSDSTLTASALSQQDLKRTIAAQYITAYGDQEQLAASIAINKLLTQEDLVLKELTRKNVYRQTDYLSFLVTLRQQELTLKQQRVQYQTDFANLNYLCGIFDTAASETVLQKPALDAYIPADPSLSLHFYKFTLDSLRLRNATELLKLDYMPKFSVFGDAGFTTSRFETIYKNFGTSFGFNLTIPIYDGHKRRYAREKIRLLEDTRINYKDFFRKQYDQQLAMLSQQLKATESLMADIDVQITYTQRLIEVNSKLLQTGDIKISDFVIAINNYLNAKSLVTQNMVSRLQIMAQMNYWNAYK